MQGQRTILALAIATLICAAMPAASAAARAVRNESVEVPGADVFVVYGSGLHFPTDATPASEPLYNVVGTALGVTWGQWSAATGGDVVRTSSVATDIIFVLHRLIPSGVYSLFYLTFGPDSHNPFCPSEERLVALHASRAQVFGPDASSFVADSSGDAKFQAIVPGHLLDAAFVAFGVVYHANGQTYGELPNLGESVTQGPDCRSSFGADAMRQLEIIQKNP